MSRKKQKGQSNLPLVQNPPLIPLGTIVAQGNGLTISALDADLMPTIQAIQREIIDDLAVKQLEAAMRERPKIAPGPHGVTSYISNDTGPVKVTQMLDSSFVYEQVGYKDGKVIESSEVDGNWPYLHDVPFIEVPLEGVEYDPQYRQIILAAVGEVESAGPTLNYNSYRFALALQRQVEHYYDQGCTHTPICKDCSPPAGIE